MSILWDLITYSFCQEKLKVDTVDFLKCYIYPSIVEVNGLPATDTPSVC